MKKKLNSNDSTEYKITPNEIKLGLLGIVGYFALLNLIKNYSLEIQVILDQISEPLRVVTEEISTLCCFIIK